MARRKATVTVRLIEKWRRLAYELENDAARCREAGHYTTANGIQGIASSLGNIARNYDISTGED